LWCERELREKMMRLREAYVEHHGSARELRRLLVTSYTTFVALFRGCLHLLGGEVPLHNDEVVSAFCERAGLDPEPFRLLLAALIVGYLLARLVSWRKGLRGASPLLDKLGFGDFNKRFEPARTELDWLSRDPGEVDAYIDDPLCGGPYTTGLWIDLLGGLLQISKDGALLEILSGLPILITGGSDDPVGGEAGMEALATRYAASGHDQLSTRIYAGGRHEMLNETNRDEFTDDLLRWIAERLSHQQANHQA